MARQPAKGTTAKRKRTRASAAKRAASGQKALKPSVPKSEPPASPELDPAPQTKLAPETKPATDAKTETESEPEKLLAAVNAASIQARGIWLGFLGLIAYFFLAITGVTHTDLLLNSAVNLPIVDVEIPLFSFFIAAPALFILVHLGLLMQHAMLSQKIQRFLNALNDGVHWGSGPHEMRSRLHAYTQTQLLAGPRRSVVVGLFLEVMSWVTIYALPILLLLNFQLTFLPYHNQWVTFWHAAALSIDLLIVILIGFFIARPSDSFGWTLIQVLTTKKLLTLCVLLATPIVLYLSFVVLTVPDRGVDAYRQEPDKVLGWAFVPADRLIEVIFTRNVDRVTGKPKPDWKFSRYLIVTDKDLVPDKDDEFEEVSFSLRGRDLRFAVLDRSDLHRADLFGVDLRGASALETRLEKTNLRFADLQGADLQGADLQGANLQGADLQGANLRSAKLQGANLSFADLQGADLRSAKLQGANLTRANIWQTKLPGEAPRPNGESEPLHLADLTGVVIAPLSEDGRTALRHLIKVTTDKTLKARLQERLRPLLSAEADEKWKTSPERKVWDELSNRPAPPPADLSDFLADLACKDDTGGHIAKRIARRGLATSAFGNTPFNGDATRLAKALTKKSCGLAAKLDDETRTKLCKLADWPEEGIGETFCAP